MLNPKVIETLGLHKTNVNSEIVIAKYKKALLSNFALLSLLKIFRSGEQ